MTDADLSSVADILDDADALVAELLDQMQASTERVEDLEQTVAAKDDRIEDLQQRVDALEERAEETENEIANAEAHREALARKTNARDDRIEEHQARELEKGAHLLAENVDQDRVTVEGNTLERITKDNGKHYFRVPGEDDALDCLSTQLADILPCQQNQQGSPTSPNTTISEASSAHTADESQTKPRSDDQPPYQDPDRFQEIYEQEETIAGTATHSDISSNTARRWLIQFNIFDPETDGLTIPAQQLQDLDPDDVDLQLRGEQ